MPKNTSKNLSRSRSTQRPPKMSRAHLGEVLAKNFLKKTPLREEILLILSHAKDPLSQGELISALTKTLNAGADRVSVYRNLNMLKKVGLVHEVEVNKYVFCSHRCEDHAHILLFCQSCHKHREVTDHTRIDHFMEMLGDFRFFSRRQPLFVSGRCAACG